MIQNKLNDYQAIPKALILDNSLSVVSRLVYCYIATKSTTCKFSIVSMASEIGCKEELVVEALKSLTESGWLSGEFDMVDDAKDVVLYDGPCKVVDKTEEKTTEGAPKDDRLELFEKCWVAYRRKGNKKVSREYWLKLKDKEKDKVLPHIKSYVASREMHFQLDFQRYLRDKTFDTIVISGNKVLYDPTKEKDGVYNPIAQGEIFYEQKTGRYIYVGFYADGMQVFDGYKDEERPDGALLVLNNARGLIIWDATLKVWKHI